MYTNTTRKISNRETVLIHDRIASVHAELMGQSLWMHVVFVLVYYLIYVSFLVGIFFLLIFFIHPIFSFLICFALFAYGATRSRYIVKPIFEMLHLKKEVSRYRNILKKGSVYVEHVEPHQAVKVIDPSELPSETNPQKMKYLFETGDKSLLLLTDSPSPAEQEKYGWPNTSFDIVYTETQDEYLGIFCNGKQLDALTEIMLPGAGAPQYEPCYAFSGTMKTAQTDWQLARVTS